MGGIKRFGKLQNVRLVDIKMEKRMKINLGCGKDVRSGYTNIDRFPQGQLSQDVYRQGDIGNLDWLTEDGIANEIVALNCLEYLPTKVVKQALVNWAKKLSGGGVLKIKVPDCHLIAKAFYQGQFNLQEYSKMVLGTQEDNDNRLSIMDTATLLSTLKEIGLTISLKRYEGVEIYVEVVK